MDSPIIEKIRKLHALAERAGTEHEAAVAAARVAELCLKHQLELGAVLIEERETEASTSYFTHKGTWRSFRNDLCAAVCILLDVAHYHSQSGIHERWCYIDLQWHVVFYGLKANVEAAVPTYKYLLETVARMTREAVSRGAVDTDHASKRSFQLGCAYRIKQEARELAAQAARANRSSQEAQMVIRVGKELKERHAKEMRLRNFRRSHGDMTDEAAFQVGYDAAGDVNLQKPRSARLLE